jgi:glycerophosphoryl diester phosphodiesterase
MNKILITVTATLLISCTNTRKLGKVESDQKLTVTFDKQGQRGCRGLMPENTIPAMLKALDLGVTTLEMDIAITKDKQVIVSHDPFFNHEITTKYDGSIVDEKEERDLKIYGMTFEETQRYDVGMKPNSRFPRQQKIAVHKPRLGDLLDSVRQHVTNSKRAFPYFNIETKTQPGTDNIYHPGPAEFVDLLMTVIKEKGMEEYVIIQSFDFRTLRYLHQNYSSVRTAILVQGADKRDLSDQITDLGFIPDIYSPEYDLVTRELIGKCHRQKIKIIPWTVNDPAKITELKNAGVDGIITDYPDLLN